MVALRRVVLASTSRNAPFARILNPKVVCVHLWANSEHSDSKVFDQQPHCNRLPMFSTCGQKSITLAVSGKGFVKPETLRNDAVLDVSELPNKTLGGL